MRNVYEYRLLNWKHYIFEDNLIGYVSIIYLILYHSTPCLSCIASLSLSPFLWRVCSSHSHPHILRLCIQPRLSPYQSGSTCLFAILQNRLWLADASASSRALKRRQRDVEHGDSCSARGPLAELPADG